MGRVLAAAGVDHRGEHADRVHAAEGLQHSVAVRARRDRQREFLQPVQLRRGSGAGGERAVEIHQGFRARRDLGVRDAYRHRRHGAVDPERGREPHDLHDFVQAGAARRVSARQVFRQCAADLREPDPDVDDVWRGAGVQTAETYRRRDAGNPGGGCCRRSRG